MSFLCKHGFHNWKTNVREAGYKLLKITKYCQRCEKIVWALKILDPFTYITDFRTPKEWDELRTKFHPPGE